MKTLSAKNTLLAGLVSCAFALLPLPAMSGGVAEEGSELTPSFSTTTQLLSAVVPWENLDSYDVNDHIPVANFH